MAGNGTTGELRLAERFESSLPPYLRIPRGRTEEEEMGEKFQRYIDHGRRAARTHPDYDQLDPMTAGIDTIASILHWVESTLTPDDIAAGGEFSPDGLVASAIVSYHGDMEDKDRGGEALASRKAGRSWREVAISAIDERLHVLSTSAADWALAEVEELRQARAELTDGE